MTMRIFALVTVVLQVAAVQGIAAEYHVASGDEISALSDKLKAGDTVLLKSAEWKDMVVVCRATGTQANPITFRAESPGKTVLTGESAVSIDGEHVIVSGLHVKEGKLKGDGIKLAGRNNQLTDCAVTGG